MPFLADDMEQVDSTLAGPLSARIETALLGDTGLRPVRCFQAGARHLTSNRPVRHPDNLAGLIIRVPSKRAFVTAWGALDILFKSHVGDCLPIRSIEIRED